MRVRDWVLLILLTGCRFTAALDLKTAAQMLGTEVSVCASLLMMPHSPVHLKGEDPLKAMLDKMNAHVHAELAKVEHAVASHAPLPNETFEILLNDKKMDERRRYFFGDGGPNARSVIDAARNYFYLRYRGRGYLEFKMNGRLVDYAPEPGGLIPPLEAGRYDAVICDLLLTEQRLTDLLHAQQSFRTYYRERRRTNRPGTLPVLDFSSDEFVEQREIFWFNLDPANLPPELAHLKSMTFSTFTEDHSFSHFAQANQLETLSDALRLARDTVTTVVSTRLTSRDVFQSLHLLAMASKVPVEVNHEGWIKNQAQGRPMLPVRLTFPSGGDPKAEPFVLGLIICTSTPCRVKDLDFKSGEIISVFPVSGPGVVRIPPARDLRHALVHGERKFDEDQFKRVKPTPETIPSAPIPAPKVLEVH